jgi:hypothetical protein
MFGGGANMGKSKKPESVSVPMPLDWWVNPMTARSIDLNNPDTYRDYPHGDCDASELLDLIYKRIGYYKMYTEYYQPDWYHGNQLALRRVENILFWFSREHKKFYKDDDESRRWFRKVLFMLDLETESLC